jgi:hypothetical protein
VSFERGTFKMVELFKRMEEMEFLEKQHMVLGIHLEQPNCATTLP